MGPILSIASIQVEDGEERSPRKFFLSRKGPEQSWDVNRINSVARKTSGIQEATRPVRRGALAKVRLRSGELEEEEVAARGWSENAKA